MISPHRIKYNNIFSNELNIPDLIMCVAMDSDNGETPSFLNREAVFSESYDGRYKRIHGFKYTETFAPKFTFFKSDFGNFEMDEVRTVLKWLTSKDTTALLETYYDDSNVVSWASIGGFVEPQLYKVANNRTIAITAVWDSTSPFALSDLYTVTQNVTNSINNKIIINIDTDDNKPVYPRVTMDHGYNGAHRTVVRIADGTILTRMSDMVENTVYYNGVTYYWKTEDSTDSAYFHSSTTNPNLTTTSVRITNKHTDFFNQSTTLTPTVVKNNNNSEKVVLDGANKIVSSNSVNRIFDDDFNLVWLPLLDGKNEITIEGNCMVTIEYREPRKIGEF